MSRKVWELHNLVSFAIGIFVNLAIGMIIYIKLPGWYALGAIMVMIGYLGLGLVNIPIGFKGVPLFLFRRIPFFVLPEGLSWILPRPFMDSENVNMKEQTSDPGPVTVLTGKGKETVRVITDAAIQWRILNPFKVLDVGLSVIIEGMNNLIKEVVRSIMADKTPDEAVQIHEELKDHLEAKATDKSEDWGIEIKNVFITQLGFAKEVTEDFENITREQKQREAERTELEHVREQIEKMKGTGLSPESSKELVQTERNKVTKTIEEKIYKGLEGTGSVGAVMDKILSGGEKSAQKPRKGDKK